MEKIKVYSKCIVNCNKLQVYCKQTTHVAWITPEYRGIHKIEYESLENCH